MKTDTTQQPATIWAIWAIFRISNLQQDPVRFVRARVCVFVHHVQHLIQSAVSQLVTDCKQ